MMIDIDLESSLLIGDGANHGSGLEELFRFFHRGCMRFMRADIWHSISVIRRCGFKNGQRTALDFGQAGVCLATKNGGVADVRIGARDRSLEQNEGQFIRVFLLHVVAELLMVGRSFLEPTMVIKGGDLEVAKKPFMLQRNSLAFPVFVGAPFQIAPAFRKTSVEGRQ